MQRNGAVMALLALVLAATAYPAASPDVSENSNVDAVDIAIRQQCANFLNRIYAVAGRQLPDGTSEIFQELITDSLPEPIREEVAIELVLDGDGALSDELKDRLNQHILKWFLQYIPEGLQQDTLVVLEEYEASGGVARNNYQLIERLQQFVSLESKRNKRGIESGLIQAVISYVIDWLLKRFTSVPGQ